MKTIVTSTGNGLKTQARRDDDSGSEKSILERSVAVAHQIVQTSEFTVEFHNQGRRDGHGGPESMGYEMTNREQNV